MAGVREKPSPASLLPSQAALLGEKGGKGEPSQTGDDRALWLLEKQKKDAAASFFSWAVSGKRGINGRLKYLLR